MNDENNIVEPAEVEETPIQDEPEGDEAAGADSPATGRAILIVKRGGVESEDRFEFQAPATIGRFDPAVGPVDVDLGGLPEGAYVSRKHAQVESEGEVWKIKDLGSSNGTFLLRDDFERIDEAELADGDEIALGNARLVFRLIENP